MYGTADTATRAVLVFGSASVLLSMVLTADTVVLAVLGFILEVGVMLTVLGFGSASVLLGLVLRVSWGSALSSSWLWVGWSPRLLVFTNGLFTGLPFKQFSSLRKL